MPILLHHILFVHVTFLKEDIFLTYCKYGNLVFINLSMKVLQDIVKSLNWRVSQVATFAQHLRQLSIWGSYGVYTGANKSGRFINCWRLKEHSKLTEKWGSSLWVVYAPIWELRFCAREQRLRCMTRLPSVLVHEAGPSGAKRWGGPGATNQRQNNEKIEVSFELALQFRKSIFSIKSDFKSIYCIEPKN